VDIAVYALKMPILSTHGKQAVRDMEFYKNKKAESQ